MILGEDYTFKDVLVKNDKETVPIELLTGPFKGVILRYTHVVVKENKDETATIKFDYDLLTIPGEHSEISLRKNNSFKQHIGLILNTLILEAVGPENDNRTTNIEGPAEE